MGRSTRSPERPGFETETPRRETWAFLECYEGVMIRSQSRPGGSSRILFVAACAATMVALSVGVFQTTTARAATIRREALLGALAPTPKLTVSATVDQCLMAEVQEERSATFAGEMTAIPGTTRMEMRIDVLERAYGETAYRTVSAPGLGVWRSSAPGVKVYKYLKQVTNLAGPAFYRAAVRFRWVGSKGRLLAATELHTRRCEQPGSPASATPTTPPPAQPTTPPSTTTPAS